MKSKANRNSPCLCGSGKKYKQCCLRHLNPRATKASSLDASILRSLQTALQHQQAGRLDEAEAMYRQVLQISPNHQDALHMLGLVAAERGHHDMAVDLIEKALQVDIPLTQKAQIHSLMHVNIGISLVQQGRIDKAIKNYRQAMTLKPDYAEVYCNLGAVLLNQGDMESAIENFRQAIALKPDYAEAHYNLGIAFNAKGQFDLAIASNQQAILIKPYLAEAHINLGNILRDRGRLDEAVACYQKSILIKTNLPEAYSNLGLAFYQKNQLQTAVEFFKQALALKSDDLHSLNNLGIALADLGQVEESIRCYHQVIALRSDSPKAYSNLAVLYQKQSQADAAVKCFQQALKIAPDDFDTYSNLLFSLSFHSQYSPAHYLEEARRYGERVLALAKPYHQWLVAPVSHGQRLRIGLISGDFGNHPVGFFIESILAHLNPERFELHAYTTRYLDHDLTERIKPRFAAWTLVAGLNDKTVAKQIYADGIHILIDLAGHTAYNRLPVFAWKPAPIQITWLGYFASTGVPGMDYFLADPVSIPEAQRDDYSETIWYLPDTRLCFTPPLTDIQVSPLPALQNGYLTFGCFQRLSKINDAVLAVWERIFQALPQARLRIQSQQTNSDVVRERLRERLAQFGIAPERVDIEEPASRDDYLSAHAEVDMILDTFPFPGGATTCEALWMGVPTVTLAGETLLSRQGASLLTCAGLPDWIAQDQDDYIARTLNHADDLQRLAQLRSKLRQQVLASPLFDARRFAQNLEKALDGMWERWTNQGMDPPHGTMRHQLSAIELAEKTGLDPMRHSDQRFQGSGPGYPQLDHPAPSTKRLLIAGWRGVNHSFAMVNQHQILALARLGSIALSHIDMPFRMTHWNRRDHDAGFSPQDQALIDALPTADEASVDAVLRICAPLYPPSPRARKTLTFAVTELGYDRNSNLYNPAQDLAEITSGENLLITPSRWARDRLLDFGFAEDKMRVVSHGVDLNAFHPLSEDELTLQRQTLAIPLDTVIFLNVGVTTWNKGIDLLVRAFAIAHRRSPNIRLILKDARDLYGQSVETIIQSVDSDNPGLLTPDVLAAILTIPGNLTWEQLRLLYGFADWYVAPYRAEGFNLPALEAQACGTPVMVSSGGATDDFCHGEGTRRIASVFHRGALGTLQHCAWVEPEMVVLESMILQAAAEGPQSAADPLRQAARENAEAYSWKRAVDGLAELI